MFRVFRKRHEIAAVQDRTHLIRPEDLLLFSTVRNEMARLPYFLDYYRKLGISHFLFVDNQSDDGTQAYLAKQDDVSFWNSDKSYRLSRFGVDWLATLQFRYGHNHWCLTVDADELLTFPGLPKIDLTNLTKKMDEIGQTALGALMLDLYPNTALGSQDVRPDQNPLEVLNWFDATGYRTQIHRVYSNEWVQGGVRERVFFADDPTKAPTLNKFPLVKWNRRFAYVNSTHQILPVGLHNTFDPVGGRFVSGVLLHTKFLPTIVPKSIEELQRKQHFQNSELYTDYHERLSEGPVLWSKESVRYEGPDQLVKLGLMSDPN